MTAEPQILRIVDLLEPKPWRVEIHDPDCPCLPCDEGRAIAADRARADAELTAFCRAGWLGAAGFAIASSIAFALDPAGAAHALVSTFTGGA